MSSSSPRPPPGRGSPKSTSRPAPPSKSTARPPLSPKTSLRPRPPAPSPKSQKNSLKTPPRSPSTKSKKNINKSSLKRSSLKTPPLSPRSQKPSLKESSFSGTTTTTTTTARGSLTLKNEKLDLRYVDSTLADDLDEEEDEEYFVKKINKFGKAQDRIIRIKREEKTFVLLDSKTRKQIKERSLADLTAIDIPPTKTVENMSPLDITFTEVSKQRPFHLFFSDIHERMHFVQEVSMLNHSIAISDKSAAQGLNDFLKFSVFKITKTTKKPRIITLLTKELEIQHFRRSKKPYRITHMSKVEGIIRNRNDKCRVDIIYRGSTCESFVFTDPAFRERFLGRFIQLWSATQVVRHSQGPPDPVVTPAKMSVFCTSWNAGESKPPTNDIMTTWLGKPRSHDLYVIAMQECSKSRDKWVKSIREHIMGVGQPDCYTVVEKSRLMDIMLFVIVKTKFMQHIKYVEKDQVACGKGGFIGNKGGVAIAFTIRDTRVCFINSHLAARAERLNKRENDYKKIIEQMDVGIKEIDILNQYHHVVWLGDLNYRIENEWEEVLELVENKNWIGLAQCDQLVQEMAEMKVFVKFTEGSLDFAPTYRWDRKENVPSNKRRQPPSWTDRILWRSFPNTSKEFEFNVYSGIPEVFGSDHRPVFATFSLIPRVPYQGDQLFHSSHRGAERHKHHSIVFTDLVMEDQSLEGVETEELKITFSSSVLENRVSSPAFIKDGYGWKLKKTVQLTPFIREVEYLKNQHLLLTVTSNKRSVEADPGVGGTEERSEQFGHNKPKIIGMGVLSINKAFEQGRIDCLMTLEGQVTMQLKGRMTTKESGYIDPQELGITYLASTRPGFHISRRPEDMLKELRNEMMRPSIAPKNGVVPKAISHQRQASSPARIGSSNNQVSSPSSRGVSLPGKSTISQSVAGNSPQLLSSRLIAAGNVQGVRGPPPPARSGLAVSPSIPRQKPGHKVRKSGDFRIM